MLWIIFGYAAVLACAIRVLLRPGRDPASRVAWLTVVLALPGVGVLAYLLLGETNIGAKRSERIRKAAEGLQRPHTVKGWEDAVPGDQVAPLFRVGRTITGYNPIEGNRGELMHDSDSAIERMVADIDRATDHVHLLFYIWLDDTNGMKMVSAVNRAAARGVTVRAMVDDLGSRDLIRSRAWKDMRAAGVKLARALPIGNPILRVLGGRIDLRNHRKIVVVDNRITYCGSQNCADPEFAPKPKYAPWIDAVMRFEGPVARQNQHLFATDWMAHVDEDLADLLSEPLPEFEDGFIAQVIGTGPTARSSAMVDMFASCMYAAREKLVITTPYFVPDAVILGALTGAAHRGVETTLILPRKNDDFAVAATARSTYADLLQAGVRVFEYTSGLLHTKSITLDADITLIGSANMDRRSFELNYENNILFQDAALTADMRARQMSYLDDCVEITLAEVADWSWRKRLLNNTLAVLGPLL
jgi:cardiolipin synthase